jgi:hypothetical protein
VAPSPRVQTANDDVPVDAVDVDWVLTLNDDLEPNWKPSQGGGGGSGNTRPVQQVDHMLVVGDAVRFDGTNYVKAQADSAADAEVVGLVSAVADANHFTLQLSGYITGLSGLTPGDVYFLSATTPGALSPTDPATVGQVSKPLLIADSSSSGYLFNFRGEVIAASGGGSLPDPWTADNTSGEVTAAVDAGSKTPLQIDGLDSQSGDLFKAFSPGLGYYFIASDIGWLIQGDGVTVTEIVFTDDGPSSPLSVDLVGTTLTVHYATDSGDTPISTLDEIFTAIRGVTLVLSFTLLPGFNNSFVPSKEATYPFTYRGSSVFRVTSGGAVSIESGNPDEACLSVVGAGENQTNYLLYVSCNGYGIFVNAHGTLLTANDADNDAVNVYVNDGVDIGFAIRGHGEIDMPLLPTADPHVAGRLWNSAGTLKVSAG